MKIIYTLPRKAVYADTKPGDVNQYGDIKTADQFDLERTWHYGGAPIWVERSRLAEYTPHGWAITEDSGHPTLVMVDRVAP